MRLGEKEFTKENCTNINDRKKLKNESSDK